MGRTARLSLLVYGIALVTLLLDQASKAWVRRSLVDRAPIEVIPGVLRLVHTTNSGGAFGLGQSAPWLFAGATIVVTGIIIYASLHVSRPLVAVALGLVLGGALGNLSDRALRGPGFSGRVTDFIDVRVWPVFNLADSAVVIGAVLLALASLGHEEKEPG